mmetsp:Transcript_27926/g.71361  ORF Transcript_27926/g.71361 Transcript_27926/m.71361 type:complete len:262 (-) Transcript_27926:1290-2075(-)
MATSLPVAVVRLPPMELNGLRASATTTSELLAQLHVSPNVLERRLPAYRRRELDVQRHATDLHLLCSLVARKVEHKAGVHARKAVLRDLDAILVQVGLELRVRHAHRIDGEHADVLQRAAVLEEVVDALLRDRVSWHGELDCRRRECAERVLGVRLPRLDERERARVDRLHRWVVEGESLRLVLRTHLGLVHPDDITDDRLEGARRDAARESELDGEVGRRPTRRLAGAHVIQVSVRQHTRVASSVSVHHRRVDGDQVANV